MIRDSGPPPAHESISRDLARALLDRQHPDLAGLDVAERFDGWDMVVFRLGDHLAMRLPRVAQAVGPLERENRLLTTVGSGWTFPHPRVVATGDPQDSYPWPWAVVTWLPGATADATPLTPAAASSVGEALAQVHVPAPAEAWSNPEQSIPLSDREVNLRWALDLLAEAEGPQGERLDVRAALDRWEAALAAPGPADEVWSHADPHGSNLLSLDGDFGGIIDWGKMARCERAVDLSFLYTATTAEGVARAVSAYREASACEDPGLDARLDGIAVTKCASWAVLDRPLNVMMAWRGFAELGLVR